MLEPSGGFNVKAGVAGWPAQTRQAPWLSSHPVRQPLRGAAAPANPDMYGYISELHGYGMAAEASGEQAEDLAATMLASTLGLDFDPEAAERAQTDLRTTAA